MTSEESEPTQERDPFGIDRLCVDYDYLLYKIHDYVSSIQLRTIEICKQQNHLVEQGIIDQVIDTNVNELKKILAKCDELENHFDMLDQLDSIVESFGPRLQKVIADHKALRKR
ncbi:LAME_0D02542g1_1 [Lachancea meyersii CBS 8951]|uniref:Biogenesis of lysosome-related organelles complex 1 subunit CNL1 n=1 Tax=Lachancea meyersii CBS 8951 TaxID=1266667 RepID=A0A1G4J7J5_9SACH|nr:LAME_0D02542g1_1 [Lachancea meyersii CBS 8951]